MKNSLVNMLNKNKLSLIVSLPSNNIDLAREAVKNGADAIKVHVNVDHRASGNSFGSVKENEDFLNQLVEEFDCPIGIVVADDIKKIKKEEILLLEKIGIDYFSIYMDDCPTILLDSKLEKTVAGSFDYKLEELKMLKKIGIQVFEASIIPGEEYGTQLNVKDLIKYSSIVDSIDMPVIVPTQRKIIPQDVNSLYKTGVKAIMAGAMSLGNDNIGKNVKELKDEIEKL